MIIVGHNPSEKAWELGHYYGNPSNRMWKLLSAAGIVPPNFTASNDDDCPITSGVGFTDVVCMCLLARGTLQQRVHDVFVWHCVLGAGGGQRPQSCTGRVVGIYFLRNLTVLSRLLAWERSGGGISFVLFGRGAPARVAPALAVFHRVTAAVTSMRQRVSVTKVRLHCISNIQ